MAPQQTAKFRTAFWVNFFTSVRKDGVANASIWTLFTPADRGFLQRSKCFVVALVGGPQDSQICGGNFPKRKTNLQQYCAKYFV